MEMPANPRFMDLTGHNYGRWATSHEQNRNKRTPKNNTSGAKGVYWFDPSKKWQVSIRVNSKLTHLGYFTDKNEAIATRLKAEQEHYS